MEPLSLSDRIKANQAKYGIVVDDIFPGTPEWEESERALGYAPKPVWLRRMAENKAKDMTGYIRPEGPDAA